MPLRQVSRKTPSPSWVLVGGWLTLWVVVAGCSLPVGAGGRSLTVGYARSSAETRQVHTKVPGFDLRLGTAHDGLNLGWSSVLVAAATRSADPVPAGTKAVAEPGFGFALPLGMTWTNAAGAHRLGWFYWRQPGFAGSGCRFVVANHAGLAVGASSQLRAVQFGLGRQTWLMVPTNAAGSWRLTFNSATAVAELHEASLSPTPPP